MPQYLASVIFALVIAAGAAVPAGAAIAPPAASNQTAGSGGEILRPAFNRIIRIGPRGNRFYSWRCAVTINGNRYYSVGITETSARARLSTITDKYFHCRRDRRGLFF